MRVVEIEDAPELQQVLWACYKYWQDDPLPLDERVICYNWVLKPHKGRFGTKFHQSRLQRLAKLGFLKKDDTSRGGGRRYYKIVDPDQVGNLLREWKLGHLSGRPLIK